ncbi:MAG TPA: methyltransferase, partial [Actinomycetes bacterium]|nr:methyltransferase [Actinomycetes bacterium]
ELAAAVGADPDLLTRALRGLVLEEVLAEEEGGRFALTELGHCLRADAPGSMRGPVLARGEVYYQAAAGTLAAVRHGGTAFEHVHGDRFFDHLRRHPEQEAAFQASMTGRSEQEAGDVVAAYDFGGIGRLVDVGGGHGILLGAILRSAPELRAVLVDQPAVVADARRRLAADGVADRCKLVGGDFFAEVPAGADAYLLSRVLHDWTDDAAHRVLATCRSAMGPGSRLLVVEAILPERAADQPAVIRMDLHMLVLLGARERTEAQFRRLLADAGFEVRRVVPTRSAAGLSVIEAAPASNRR